MSEYYAVQRSGANELEHYGVKGMKWHVRKAIAKGSDRALGRQYKKAAKKLAKLEKRAASGKKYAKRAAKLGAGAAAAGGLAAVGTEGVAKGIKAVGNAGRYAMRKTGNAITRLSGGKYSKVGNALKTAGNRTNAGLIGASKAVNAWGNSNSIGWALKTGGRKFQNANGLLVARATKGKGIVNTTDKLADISNNKYARIAAGAVGAGLAGAAGYNAYRAATTKRAAKKAAAFKSEMNKAFAGTKYANGAPRQGKKRRKR